MFNMEKRYRNKIIIIIITMSNTDEQHRRLKAMNIFQNSLHPRVMIGGSGF